MTARVISKLHYKVIYEHLNSVGNTDVEAEIELISARALILNTPSSHRTRSSVLDLVVPYAWMEERATKMPCFLKEFSSHGWGKSHKTDHRNSMAF